MLKKIIATGMVATALMLGGCGEADQEGLDSLAAQNAIDKGDPQLAIDLILDGQTLAVALTTMSDADKLTLAAAYMKDSGYSLTDLVTIVAEDTTTTTAAPELQAATSTNVDKFTDFKDKILARKNANSLDSVNNAIECYLSSEANDILITTDRSSVSDRDLKIGLAFLVKAVLLLDDPATTDQDIADFLNNEVFPNIEQIDGLTDLQSEVDKVKLDIANNTNTNYLEEYVDGTDYSNIVVEASDITEYRY